MRKVKIIKNGHNTVKFTLTGEYLRDNGFEIGDIISVYISPTEILIKKGIHSGQNWLKTPLTVSRVLKKSVVRGMRWLPDRGTGELAAKPNIQHLVTNKPVDISKFERPIEDYYPLISINNNIIINNGYNIGDYLNVDFVAQGEIRLTKANVDNKVITNDFEYTKDNEVQIGKDNNKYFLILKIILDRTILSKTNFKEHDIVTLYIKDNILYIKNGKENIPNCYYLNIYISRGSLFFNIVKSKIFKELNLEAGDFVTLKIVSPDLLSLTKKNTESNNLINENKLSSYIRKIVRNIINESFK